MCTIAVRKCEEVLRSGCVDGICLPVVVACDGHRDCVDGSDEEKCPPPQPSCRPDEVVCGGMDGGCVFKGSVCDGVDDCIDGSDEDCGEYLLSVNACVRYVFLRIARTTPPQSLCLANQFSCTDGCVPLVAFCDGSRDCSNGEDEQSCSKLL